MFLSSSFLIRFSRIMPLEKVETVLHTYIYNCLITSCNTCFHTTTTCIACTSYHMYIIPHVKFVHNTKFPQHDLDNIYLIYMFSTILLLCQKYSFNFHSHFFKVSPIKPCSVCRLENKEFMDMFHFRNQSISA